MRAALVLAATLAAGAASQARAADETKQPVFVEEGDASFYSDKFHGKTTASGDKFSQSKLTAAHPELPLGSKATVTNLENGKQVEVEVNDRGPYAKNRSLDVSKAAAKKLDMTKAGEVPVKIEATKGQVAQAIESPAEKPKVEAELKQARKKAAAEGTPQPRVSTTLEAPSP